MLKGLISVSILLGVLTCVALLSCYGSHDYGHFSYIWDDCQNMCDDYYDCDLPFYSDDDQLSRKDCVDQCVQGTYEQLKCLKNCFKETACDPQTQICAEPCFAL